MHTCTGLVGPKTGKVKKLLVFKPFLKVSKGAGGAQECKEAAEKYRPGVGPKKGKVKKNNNVEQRVEKRYRLP